MNYTTKVNLKPEHAEFIIKFHMKNINTDFKLYENIYDCFLTFFDLDEGPSSIYYNKTFAQWHKEGYIVMEFDDAWEQITQATEAHYVRPFKEITEDDYHYNLEQLPPENWTGGIFRMCEYMHSNITEHFVELDGKFYKGYRRNTTAYADIRAEIRKERAGGKFNQEQIATKTENMEPNEKDLKQCKNAQLIVKKFADNFNYKLDPWKRSESCLGLWEYSNLTKGSVSLRVGTSGGGVINVDGSSHDPEGQMNLEYDNLKMCIISKTKGIKHD